MAYGTGHRFGHFQFAHDFVTVLELISLQLRDDAERPT
jgi:hypothetical protein